MPAKEENLDIEVRVIDSSTAVLTVGGELDLETATFLHHHLANQFTHGRRHLVLDISALAFMDSSGLNVLIKGAREAREMNGDLYLAAPNSAVRRLLEITGLSFNTPVLANVEEALVAAGQGGSSPQGQQTQAGE